MGLPRYIKLSGASLTVAFSIAAGCGGSDSSNEVTVATACKHHFSDSNTDCVSCLEENCNDELLSCCLEGEDCEPIAKCSRGTGCVGSDCYEQDGMPGGCKSLIDQFGGADGAGMKAAVPLSECTAKNCTMCKK